MPNAKPMYQIHQSGSFQGVQTRSASSIIARPIYWWQYELENAPFAAEMLGTMTGKADDDRLSTPSDMVFARLPECILSIKLGVFFGYLGLDNPSEGSTPPTKDRREMNRRGLAS